MTGTVLLVDDDAPVREALVQTLELADMRVIAAGSFVAAKDHITCDFAGVILSDLRMPGRDGFHLLGYAQEQDPDLPVVLLTGEGDIPIAVRAIESGAFDFLEKPCAPAALREVLARALARRDAVMAARAETARAEAGDPAARMIFGISPQSETLRMAARRAAATQSDVLITGPTGSGLSKVAEVVHLCSPQAQAPFEKRAAAGLDRAGLAEALDRAAGGALFLDQITRASEDIQLALSEIPPGTVRLIAGSTEPEVAEMMQADLYYRLSVSHLYIPALAERPEDIPVLYRRYAAQAAEQSGVPVPEITQDQLAALMAQSWPGNARALMNAAMRQVLGVATEGSEEDLGLAERMARVEKSLLIEALEQSGGRASDAARALKLARKTFYDKLARHNLKPEDYRL